LTHDAIRTLPAGASKKLSGRPTSPTLIAVGATSPEHFILARKEIAVGSAASNDLIINEKTVSRRHAKLVRDGETYRVTDLKSTNGTFLNGRRIDRVILARDGDELRFGTAAYVLHNGPAVAERRPFGIGGTAPSRKSVSRIALAGSTIVLFAGGFWLTMYLLQRTRPDANASGRATAQITAPSVMPRTAPTSSGPLRAETTQVGPKSGSPEAKAPSKEVLKWLGPLNHYRSMAGLAPVEADDALSVADAAHSRYLVKNFADSIKHSGLGGEAHMEDSARPWYSEAGAQAAQSSNIEEGFHPADAQWLSPAAAVEGWLSIPFHRLWILNPNLRRAGYGQYCESGVCVGSLDILHGVDGASPGPSPLPKPIEYPPGKSELKFSSSGNEWPDPLTACPGYAHPVGLSVTLQLGTRVDARLSDYSIAADGSSAPLEACAFSADTYVNPDPAQQQRVRDMLRDFGAVVLIPRAVLRPGDYWVSMTVAGRAYTWSFTIGG
jgi:uncharacterized protein YkwD